MTNKKRDHNSSRTISVSGELHRLLQQCSAESGMPISAIVERVLTDNLDAAGALRLKH